MAFHYRASCVSEDAARDAFHSSGALFDSVEDVTALAMKRSGSDLLFRFENSESIVRQLVAVLQESGMFERIAAISAAEFETAVSNAV